eukprot:s2296_g2.t1
MQTMRQTSAKLRGELRGCTLWDEGADRNGEDTSLLLAAVCAGLFPNLALRRGGRGKFQVNGGRLEAVPHPSSVASFSGKGADWWEGTGNGAQDVEGEGGRSNVWVCFNELSQLEETRPGLGLLGIRGENYSLAGISPARSSALLLLCGEGPLSVRTLGGDPIKHPSAEAEAGSAGASEEAFSRWWAESLGDSAPERPQEQVAVSLHDLSWVDFKWWLQRVLATRTTQLLRQLLIDMNSLDKDQLTQLFRQEEVGKLLVEWLAKATGARAQLLLFCLRLGPEMVFESGRALTTIRALCMEEGWEVASLARQVMIKWVPGCTKDLPEIATAAWLFNWMGWGGFVGWASPVPPVYRHPPPRRHRCWELQGQLQRRRRLACPRALRSLFGLWRNQQRGLQQWWPPRPVSRRRR